MRERDAIFIGLPLIAAILISPALSTGVVPPTKYFEGVWDNFDFSMPADNWSNASHRLGGDNGLIDLVVAQENLDGLTYLPIPFESHEYLRSSSKTDEVEPYLEKFDGEGLNVVLSMQPGKTNVTQLMEDLLARYGHHKSIIGVNVDLEWKKSGRWTYVSNVERDVWLNTIKRHNPNLKLFLTYFNYTHFPSDAKDLVILFDGENATQSELLSQFKELAQHYNTVGIYTGYSSSSPQTASNERILSAVPSTKYIIHTQDVFQKDVIFLLSDLQVDWLEDTSIELIDMHKQKFVPVVLGVIPANLNEPNVGGGFLPGMLKDLNQNMSDLFEIAEYAYSVDMPEGLSGKSYAEQKKLIENGQKTLLGLDIKPVTLIPALASADRTTIKVAEDLGFRNIVTSHDNLNSDKLLILDSWVYLMETNGNNSIIKSPEQLMKEIDSKDEKAVIILYQIQNFQQDLGNNFEELGKILDTLKGSGKYRFMTAKEYMDTIHASTQASSDNPKLSGWSALLGLIALLVVRQCLD